MIDLYYLQKECAITALKRKNITQDDLILPECGKFLNKLREEIREADVCCQNVDLKPRTVNGKPEGLLSELADLVITSMTFAECLGLNLEQEIIRKIEYNKTRSN